MAEYADFEWTSEAELAELSGGRFPWEHYRNTVVEFDGHGTVFPVSDGEIGCQDPPLGCLHVIAAVQPGGEPGSPDSRARLQVLDNELRSRRLRPIPAVGRSFDGTYRECSRAVFGLSDDQARDLGRMFGQVAIFGWSGPWWSLLACATDRQEYRGWRFEPR